MQWGQADSPHVQPSPVVEEDAAAAVFFPLTDTVRLYAGWLLAWYFIIYALGSYQTDGRLPFAVPFLESLYRSSLILSFSCAAFLFLLCTSLHRASGGGALRGLLLGVAGGAIFVLFQVNV